MKDIITLESKVVDFKSPVTELNSKVRNTREIVMYVHTIDEENLNGLTFTYASTEKYMLSLINKPVVVKMNTTESDFKGHEPVFDESGKIIKLDTIAVGTITDAWIEDRIVEEETKKALMCKATIWSYKFPTAIEIMENLFSEGNLDTSVEVAIFSYTDDSTSEHRKTDEIEYLSNCMLGSTILPADSNAGVIEMFYKEVAEALKLDKPGDNPSLNINSAKNGGVVILLSHDEIREQLRSLLNPNDNEENGWKIDYYTWDMVVFDTFCVARHAETGKLFRFDYEVQNESTVALQGEPREQMVQFVDVPEGEEVEVSGLFTKFKEYEGKIDELNSTIETKEQELAQLQQDKEQLNTEIESAKKELTTKDEALQTTETEANEKIIKLGEVVDELKTQINELAPVKEEFDRIQAELAEKAKQDKINELKTFALNSKVVSEKELEEDETIKQMIDELNEVALKSLIADRIVDANKPKSTELNNKKDGDVVIATPTPEDLIPQSTRDEMYAPVSRNK